MENNSNKTPKIKSLNHIAIAVPKLEPVVEVFVNKLGFKFDRIEEVESEQVRTAFLATEAGEHIELLEPMSESSAIAKFLEKNRPGLHHIAFNVEDINEALETVKENEIKVIHDKPKIGAGGLQIAFLHPKSTYGTLMEFCEEKEE
jgi:methylmalonyl-CoA/ethylmalonyl-CoA epimerase